MTAIFKSSPRHAEAVDRAGGQGQEGKDRGLSAMTMKVAEPSCVIWDGSREEIGWAGGDAWLLDSTSH